MRIKPVKPGSPIPFSWFPQEFVLPLGFEVRQDSRFVYLLYGAEDLVDKWSLSTPHLHVQVMNTARRYEQRERSDSLDKMVN